MLTFVCISVFLFAGIAVGIAFLAATMPSVPVSQVSLEVIVSVFSAHYLGLCQMCIDVISE